MRTVGARDAIVAGNSCRFRRSLDRRACAGRDAALIHPLRFEQDALNEARTRDLDGDGVSGVILVGKTDEGWSLQFLVRRR